jgi:hypothetical protein
VGLDIELDDEDQEAAHERAKEKREDDLANKLEAKRKGRVYDDDPI